MVQIQWEGFNFKKVTSKNRKNVDDPAAPRTVQTLYGDDTPFDLLSEREEYGDEAWIKNGMIRNYPEDGTLRSYSFFPREKSLKATASFHLRLIEAADTEKSLRGFLHRFNEGREDIHTQDLEKKILDYATEEENTPNPDYCDRITFAPLKYVSFKDTSLSDENPDKHISNERDLDGIVVGGLAYHRD